MTRSPARTDAHRPSVIVPAHYVSRMWYSLAHEAEGWPQPAINLDRVLEMRRAALDAGKQVFGTPGGCGVCGAHYKHGVVFEHEPTGDLVHMGYDCAAKYEMMVDESEHELARQRVHAATAKQITRERNAAERAAFLERFPELALHLTLGEMTAESAGIAADDYRMLGAHQILADLAHKFLRWRELSDKQVAFAAKLYAQITTPPAQRPVDLKIAAPTGTGARVTFTGEIVSVKLHVSEQWGPSWKCTIKVQNDEGAIWLAWGGVPRDLLDRVMDVSAVQQARYASHRDSADSFERAVRAELRGLPVEVTATLEASSDRVNDGGEVIKKADPSFAFMKRPSMTVAGMYDHPRPPPASSARKKKQKIGSSKATDAPARGNDAEPTQAKPAQAQLALGEPT